MQNIINGLKDNGIKYHKKFERVVNNGCIEDYQSLFDSIIKKIDDSIREGVNNGFSKSQKESISQLTNIVVEITKQDNAKKLNKITKKAQAVMNGMEKDMKNEDLKKNTKMVDEIKKRIDYCIRGAEVYLGLNQAENRKDIIRTSIEKLKELRLKLDEVYDNTTTNALDKAFEIAVVLSEWEVELGNRTYNSRTVEKLDRALQVCEEWKTLRVEAVKKGLFRKGNIATDAECAKIVVDGNSDMYLISLYKDKIEDINIFSQNLAEYKETIATGQYSNEKNNQEKANLIAKRDGYLTEIENYKKQVQNGTCPIPMEEAMDRCIELQEEIDYINDEIAQIQNDITLNDRALLIYNRIITNLDRINDYIKSCQNEPAKLAVIANLFDFQAMTRVMLGRGSPEDIEKLAQSETIRRTIKANESITISNAIEQLRNIPSSRAPLPTLKTKKVNKQEQQAKREKAAEFFGLNNENPVQPQQQEVTEQENRPTNINDILDDGDR